MKKVLTVLVALAMIFSLAASAEAAASAAGLWTLTTAESAGVTFDAVEMGMEMTMDLADDGTCVLTLNGENEMGTWEQNGAAVAVLDSTGAEQAFQPVSYTHLDVYKRQVMYSHASSAANPTSAAARRMRLLRLTIASRAGIRRLRDPSKS